jgi:hypothetical protein
MTGRQTCRQRGAVQAEMNQAPGFNYAAEQHQRQDKKEKNPAHAPGAGLNFLPSAGRVKNQQQGSNHPVELLPAKAGADN